MPLNPAICFVSGILAILAGFLVLAAGWKKPLNRSWFFFNLCFSLFILGLGVGFTSDPKTAIFSEKIMDTGTIFVPIATLYFILVLTGLSGRRKKFLTINFLIALVFAALMLFTGYFFQGLGDYINEMGYYAFNYNEAVYIVFLVWFLAVSAYAFYILFSEARKKDVDPVKRQQMVFVFWGVLITYISASVNFLLDYVTIPFYYNLLVPFYLVFVGYAIVKNELFNIKVIATELLVGAMGFVLLIFPFLMPSDTLRLAAGAVFVVYCFIGYLLIKTTMEEVKAKEFLEEKVKERTQELAEANKGLKERQEEVEKWYKLTIGREMRMAELKDKIKEMEEKKNA